jgi:hypothetical protein
MSSTQFSFAVKVRVGEEIIPLRTEITTGSGSTEDGVENGFLFRLDLEPGDPPLLINLGDMIAFIEKSLGAGEGSLSKNPNLDLIAQAFPDYVGGSHPFTSANTTQIEVKSFEVNSTAKEFLFSFSLDVTSTDPTQGLIAFPPAVAQWVRIDNLAIAFSATKKS